MYKTTFLYSLSLVPDPRRRNHRRKSEAALQRASAGWPRWHLPHSLAVGVVEDGAGEFNRLALLPQHDVPLPQPNAVSELVARPALHCHVAAVSLLVEERPGLVAYGRQELLGRSHYYRRPESNLWAAAASRRSGCRHRQLLQCPSDVLATKRRQDGGRRDQPRRHGCGVHHLLLSFK